MTTALVALGLGVFLAGYGAARLHLAVRLHLASRRPGKHRLPDSHQGWEGRETELADLKSPVDVDTHFDQARAVVWPTDEEQTLRLSPTVWGQEPVWAMELSDADLVISQDPWHKYTEDARSWAERDLADRGDQP